MHDLVFQVWERKAGAWQDAPARWVSAMEAKRVRKWETEALRGCQKVMVLSEKDRRLALGLSEELDVHVLPPRIEPTWAQGIQWDAGKKEMAVLFLGSMQRVENVDAVEWFAEEALPLIERTFPDVVMYVVGARPRARVIRLARKQKNVVVTGFVEDPREYFERALAAVAPLRMGGGVKIKVLESMKAGLAVVGTEVAAEGIDASAEEGLVVENDAEGLARQVVGLLGDRERARELGGRAREFVSTRYDRVRTEKVLEQVFDF